MASEVNDTILFLERKRDKINEAIALLRSVNGESNGTKTLKRSKYQRVKNKEQLEKVLDLLQKNRNGLNTLDIANRLSMKYNSVWYNLKVLEGRKRIVQVGEKGKGGYVYKVV